MALVQVDYEYLPSSTEGTVRLRVPIVSDSLLHAIFNAFCPIYWTSQLEGRAFDPFTLVQDTKEALTRRLGNSNLQDTISLLSELLNLNILVVSQSLVPIARSASHSPKFVTVIQIGNHYETVGIMSNNSISTIFDNEPTL